MPGWWHWGFGADSASGRWQRGHHRASSLCPASPDLPPPGCWDGPECCAPSLRPACGGQTTAPSVPLATYQGHFSFVKRQSWSLGKLIITDSLHLRELSLTQNVKLSLCLGNSWSNSQPGALPSQPQRFAGAGRHPPSGPVACQSSPGHPEAHQHGRQSAAVCCMWHAVTSL